ncbi:YceI family protein [Emticicia sp. 17c]|uniref:YceI family protein n=1 Tax=Emticicia sp. 17c TaxID=3127704 RepID=UPI00301BD5BD
MKKGLLIILLGLFTANVFAQNQWICRKGETSFFSETPVENIAALNKSVVSLIDFSKGEIAVKMTMTDFKFQNHLMEEHFNENYMESEKYPTASFVGKIQEPIDISKNGTYDISAKGQLTMHGVTKERVLKGKLTVNNNEITLVSNFDVALKDHKIEIPTLVIAKIAEVIAIKDKFVYTKK